MKTAIQGSILATAAVLSLALCGLAAADAVWSPQTGWTRAAQGKDVKGAAQFDKAFSAYLKGKYARARDLLTTVSREGEEPLVEQSRILIAECYLGEKHYSKAFEKFEEFLDAYPASAYVDRAFAGELDVARAALRGARIKAIGLRIWSGYGLGEKVADKISSRRPLSDYAREAQIELARSYYRRQMYIESSSAFQQYLELFGESPEAREALLGLGTSLFHDAPGALYDPLALYRAQAALADFARQYPSSSAAPDAQRLSDRARGELARHYCQIGRYYVKKGQVKSAAMYFDKVLKEYSDTAAASTAKSYVDVLGRAR